MQSINQSGLAVVFRNPEPKRELQYPESWLLLTPTRQLKIFVSRDGAPHVVRKEAA
jgi:hypothetical protein